MAEETASKKRKLRPARGLEARENQLIALAVDCAEEQLRNGTASSQVICHYLKLGSTREKAERKLLEEQTRLAAAKTEAVQSAQELKDLYAEAVKVFRVYSGVEDDNEHSNVQ